MIANFVRKSLSPMVDISTLVIQRQRGIPKLKSSNRILLPVNADTSLKLDHTQEGQNEGGFPSA